MKKIINLGHKSIAEHDYLVFALENVTPIIEQTIISYRLTSFTIKSRRNVDFRDSGFYVPDFKDNLGNIVSNNTALQQIYTKYMKLLFDKYGELVNEYLPIEDCRYILPYSYYSNIIMGCDANELFKMVSDMLYGKTSNITEVHDFALKLKNLIDKYVPYITTNIEEEESKDYYKDNYSFVDKLVKNDIKDITIIPKPMLNNYTQNPDNIVLCNILMTRYQISFDDANSLLEKLSMEHPTLKNDLMNSLIHSKNQRELEQVAFSFEIPISLAVLTHITRHRMQSLLVPDFVPLWNMGNYKIPDTLKEKHLDDIKYIFEYNKKIVNTFKKQGVRDEDLVYFYLSGNMCNIFTTMNARTLEWVSRMRCCKKAQWEMQDITNEIVRQVKEVSPLIGMSLGPSCNVLQYCSEGKDSCKTRGVIVKKK